MRTIRNRPEEELQKQVVEWLNYAMPAPVGFWFHVPNGGKRNIREATKFRAMGVRAGVPDLCFIDPAGRSYFIEMKAPGMRSRTSDKQREVLEILDDLNVGVAVCDSLQDVESTLRDWGFELKAGVQ